MSQEIARPLPHNDEAERGVLGAILIDNGQFDIAAQKLEADDFFDQRHVKIYKAIGHMAADQRPIDLLSLTEELRIKGQLDGAAHAYIAQLIDGVPHISHLAHYAQIVKDKSILRGLIHAADAIQRTAFVAETDPAELVERAERAIAGIGERQASSELRSLADIVDANMEDLEKLLTNAYAISGLPTGYPQLDHLLTGLHPGNVCILAARPSIGKTAMALNIAENCARKGTGVAFFSLEMGEREVFHRLASSVGRINLRQMRSGGMDREDWRRLTEVLANLRTWPIYIDDANPTTVAEMGAKVRWLQRKKQIGLIVIDYLQLLSAQRGRYANRNEEVGATSRALKALAKQTQRPILVLSQLTRASEKEERRPQLSDLRESGAIEQDADIVLFIHRPKAFAVDETPAEKNRTELIVAKQRNGPTDVVGFVFLARYTRFEENAPELAYAKEESGDES